MLGLNGGAVVSANTLAELLWGARPPRTAVKALQTHISSLRRALGDGFVLTEGTGWTLSTTEIDATRYKLAARRGRDAIAAGDAGQAVARFDEALALWRGIPELPDGPRAVSEKTRWIEGHAALVEDRADALLATGRAAEIVGELEAAIADAPLRERRWGQLMLALYRAGRQGEALAAFQRARSLLADELGVDPGPNLRRLEGAIVAQDGALEIPVPQQISTVTRAVTFLLTDIEGSTAAWEAQADAMAVALARHDEIVEQVVTSRGGRLVKTRGEGDATFSVFDRPSAAAAAAIELQEAIRHEPWALADPMRVRVALHTGEVELRDGDYFGRAVNRAARLRSLAAGGQILCSGATAELVIDSISDDVVLVDLGKRQLKNLARPEHVFELRLETADDDSPAQPAEPPIQRPGLPAVLTGPGPFVGRGRELSGLLAAWQSTLAVGTRAVLVAGEPGVGKTRLAGEWSRQAYEQGAVVLYGRCDEDLGAAYQPFAEALRTLVPCLGTNRLRALRGVEALLPLIPGLADAVPDLPTPSRSDPDTERYALFDAVVALLTSASTSASVVLILDDLHWAAKPTLLLLRHLLRFGEHARVQIVGTYRSTDLDRSHPLAAMLADLHRDGTATRLALGGLDEDDVTAYVAEAGYDDEELARALAGVTGGNPFFLIEALRHVDESGGRWDPSTLPQGVREAVSRRLSRLPSETNKALAAAAVVGSRFPLALVETVVGEDLIDAFDEACQAGIVIEEPGGRYRFNHALVRQSLLAELASVRRMRLHQRIAATLEAESGADDEVLAELAYHYFECAWAGNAVKAVEYCRRAADQAMARLAYEGAADLYDRALHALEELDDELPDRDALQAELLVARCEALLAAGDVVSAAGAVSRLQEAAGDSVRLAAWGTCFDGQLSMLTDPERLDEIEAAVGAAAEKLAGLEDAAGEAMAHTVRAACLARLGRIGDAETALDQALTAARRAHDHRRVNAVLAGAPLAALWGPNPVPRAGGRCLDVVRLLRITTGSPVVEATSTRCQGVLDALRGRPAAGRALIDSARRSLTELGMRHALLEVDQFAGIVELVADDPAAAEPHLRRAYEGFRRMGLEVDTADSAALLARTYLALDRDADADELCTESERLAGHALKPSIAWRAVRAQLLARGGAHDEARRVAQEAVAVAERTDILVDHGDACLALATVLDIGGDTAGARAAAERAAELYELKGAAALAEKARGLLETPNVTAATVASEPPPVELHNVCVGVVRKLDEALDRSAWDEYEQLFAAPISCESRRNLVGYPPMSFSPSEWVQEVRKIRDTGARHHSVIVAVRGERLALTRMNLSTTDTSPGAPRDEMLQLVGLDEEGRIAKQIWFDVDDLDAAMAELDALHAGSELDTPCVRLIRQLDAAYDRDAWEEVGQCIAAVVSVESRRKIVGMSRVDNSHSEWLDAARHYRQTLAQVRYRHTVVAARGERLALTSLEVGPTDQSPGAPRDALLQLYGVDEAGRLALHIHFDFDDLDAAMAELDARYLAGEAAPHAHVWRSAIDTLDEVNRHEPGPILSRLTYADHRRISFGSADFGQAVEELWALVPDAHYRAATVHALDAHGTVATLIIEGADSNGNELQWSRVVVLLPDEPRMEVYDDDDLNAALTRFDELSWPTPRLENAAGRVCERFKTYFAERDWDSMADLIVEDVCHDDRRRVVGAGVRFGRDAHISNLQAIADVQIANVTFPVVATRGAHLLLARSRYLSPDSGPQTFVAEALEIIEIDADERVVRVVTFDLDDIDAAYEELDARYLAGEAAPHAPTWSVVVGVFAALARHEAPAATDLVSIDHRRGTPLAHSDLKAIVTTLNDLTPDLTNHVESVHLLDDHGALFTQVSRGRSPEGFDAEWRIVNLLTVDGDKVNRCELFDEADIDAAIATFTTLSPAPQLENVASRVSDQMHSLVKSRRWEELSALFAEDIHAEDRRLGLGGEYVGRASAMAESQATAALGGRHIASTVIAIRGDRLALKQVLISADGRPDSFQVKYLRIVEVDADDHVAALVTFDSDGVEAAFKELDARYATGEAAPHARVWATVTEGYSAFNRRELPATSPDWTNVDHRRGVAFAPGDLIAFMRASWTDTPDVHIDIEAVHRLTNVGAVVSAITRGTSVEGFNVEWRHIVVMGIDGDMLSRTEMFDEADLGVALAKFDQLSRPATRLENAASQVNDRFDASFAARDWVAMAAMVAEDMCNDDRRRVVGAGIQRGRDAEIANMRAIVGLGVEHATSIVVATRGQRLALLRTRFSGHNQNPDAFHTDIVDIVEINADNRITRRIAFDADDIDAAFKELDACYLEGEAAVHARAWSVVTGNVAAFNGHELPATTPDVVNIDHRRVTPFGSGDLAAYVDATWEQTPDLRIYIEAVHRLSEVCAVFTYVATGTTRQNFEAEWRAISASTFDGDLINRSERFDETDLDAALALFDELSRPAPRLQNRASRVGERLRASFAARDWEAMAEIVADDLHNEDRRRVANAGIRYGRESMLADMRSAADMGIEEFVTIEIATRGEHLGLVRSESRYGAQPGAFFVDNLAIIEIDADGRITAQVLFDPDDLDAAFAELDRRYLADEAAAYAHTYSVIAGAFTAVNRRELPSITSDLVSIDHRRPIAFAPGELIPYLQATLNEAPEIRIDIHAVHRLSSVGAVVTHVWHNTSQQGFDAEWRVIGISTVDGDRINRCELFDETDLDAALARFDELSRPTQALENTASQVSERLWASFTKRDWHAVVDVLAEGIVTHDRRHVVNAGIRRGREVQIADLRAAVDIGAQNVTLKVMGTRGDHLALSQLRFSNDRMGFAGDVLAIAEIDADGRIESHFTFDVDDLDAAFEELDARYLAGDAAAHAGTWSVITEAYAALNRHELAPTPSDWAYVDHHRLALWQGDFAVNMRAAWEVAPDWRIHVVAVHRLTRIGAVLTAVASGTSREGFDAEQPGIAMLTVRDGMINRLEYFDEADLDTALARFDELIRPQPRLENAASHVAERYWSNFSKCQWDALAELLADDFSADDRRRIVGAGLRVGREAEIQDLRAIVDLGLTNAVSTFTATRGSRLVLGRVRFSRSDHTGGSARTEILGIIEIDDDQRIKATVVFDPDDLDAAYEELDSRFLAGEGAAHSHVWTLVNQTYAGFNRHELSPTTPDWVNIDHRRGIAPEPGDMHAYVSSMWTVAPDVRTWIENVHRLTDLGAVFTHAEIGTSQDGFGAEWREITLLTFDGNLIDRCELFDEDALDVALARFDELSPPAAALENAATRGDAAAADAFNRRELDSYLTAFSANAQYDDRRKGLRNSGAINRELAHGMLFTGALSWRVEIEPVGVRGRHLALTRHICRDNDGAERPIVAEVLALVETDENELISRSILFDPEDTAAAFEELDALYLAGEASANSHIWARVARTYARFNRREISATTPDWVNISHCRGIAFAPGDMISWIRAAWDVTPDVKAYIRAVHRLSVHGAVVTIVGSGTSQEGFDAEWWEVHLIMFQGDLINRNEQFEEADLDAALARFDELCASAPLRGNVATAVLARQVAAFNRRDIDGYLALFDDDGRYEDRRKGLRDAGPIKPDYASAIVLEAGTGWQEEIECIAVGGRHLLLCRATFRDHSEVDCPIAVEALVLAEVTEGGLISAFVVFDCDDIDAALTELTARRK